MGNAPSLRNIVIEFLRKFLRCLTGDGISPGAERDQEIIVCIKCKVSVHHCGNTDSGKRFHRNAVFVFDIFLYICVAGFQSCENFFFGISPDAVMQTVFPAESAHGEYGSVLTRNNAFDSGRTKLNPEICFACFNTFFCSHSTLRILSRRSGLCLLPCPCRASRPPL